MLTTKDKSMNLTFRWIIVLAFQGLKIHQEDELVETYTWHKINYLSDKPLQHLVSLKTTTTICLTHSNGFSGLAIPAYL